LILKAHPIPFSLTAIMPRLLLVALATLCASCATSTLPTAESLTFATQQLRQQAQPEFDDLDRQRSAGTLSATDHAAAKTAIEKRIGDDARQSAWTRHFLAQSERKALGLPTPDQPVANTPPNAMLGGAAGGSVIGDGTLYRPFTQQSQGAAGLNFNGGFLPTVGTMNNASTRYVQPAQ
jgi:hypothetical protein